MAYQRLKNYLRTYRRRHGFSQEEISRLLGASSGTKVSRYESFSRHPALIAVFAYEIIFNTPVRELFAGTYDSVRRDVRERAAHLLKAIGPDAGNPRTVRKLDALRRIVESQGPNRTAS